MNVLVAGLLALVVGIIVLVVGAYVRWNYTGWKKFRYKSQAPYAQPESCKPKCPDGSDCASGACNFGSCETPACPDGSECVAGACYPRDAASWGVAQKDASALRFRKAIFTVAVPGGPTRTKDVTANLNAMAVAYEPGRAPPKLRLVRPLNALSFTIPGFNTADKLADGATREALRNAKVTLSGEFKAL